MSENEIMLYVNKQVTRGCLYVDHMIYMGSCETFVAEFKSFLMKEFEISDLGTL